MKNYVILGISILSGLIAFLKARQHFAQREAELGLKGRKVTVLVARHNIAGGTTLNKMDFVQKEYPVSLLNEIRKGKFGVVNLEDPQWKSLFLQKWSLAVSLDKGQPLRWKQLDMGESSRDYTFQGKITKEVRVAGRSVNLRALTLPVDSITSVANLISPNDNVDIISTFRNYPLNPGSEQMVKASMILLQNVKVLAVGQKYRGAVVNKSRGGYSSITLEVTPKEAEMLVFANQEGKLHFILRNHKDYNWTEDTQRVDFGRLESNADTYLKERRAWRQPAN